MKPSRIKDLLIAILLVLLVAGISHFVITNPLGPSRILYYGEAFIIQWETRCEEGAPELHTSGQALVFSIGYNPHFRTTPCYCLEPQYIHEAVPS
jgi:hypothetical protein